MLLDAAHVLVIFWPQISFALALGETKQIVEIAYGVVYFGIVPSLPLSAFFV
jgi:hypothetical protein